jgi:hypothetical protein
MSTRKLESIVLEQFIQLGDRVIVNIDPEKRHWVKISHVDGTVGTVVGFKQYHDYVARFNNFGKVQGVYSKRGLPLVRFEDRTGDYFSAHDLAFKNPTLKEKRSAERIARGGLAADEEYSSTTRISDLPETPFWEHDIVTVHSHKWGGDFGAPYSECETPAVLKIDSINYDDDGNHTYSVSGMYASGHTIGQIRADKKELKLVARGNVWRYYNDEPLIFADLKEEIGFHRSLGKIQTLRNPLRNSYYLWTMSEALAAIRDGRGDAFSHAQGFFGGHSRIEIKRFEDRDLGERVRATTIEGWKDTPTDTVDPEMDAWVESQIKY